MKRLIIGLSLSIAAATGLSAQTVYYPVGAHQRTAYPDNWTGGPPIATQGTQRGYGLVQPTYYTTAPQTAQNLLLAPTHRVNVGNHRLVSGPCGWGGNCTSYDDEVNFTYIHPAQQ